MDRIQISKRSLLCIYAMILTLWFIVGLSVGLTQMCKLPSITEPILTIWGSVYDPEALVMNSKGDVGEIRWRTKGDVTTSSLCAVEHQNQVYILGHGFFINYLFITF